MGESGDTWFDAKNWPKSKLPDFETDVEVDVQVLINQYGAQARSIDVLSGGELVIGEAAGGGASLGVAQTISVHQGAALTVISNGSVTALNIVVQAGGTLSLNSSSASLFAFNLFIEPGATLIWNGGIKTLLRCCSLSMAQR
jgi:hypothetical protein